MSLASLLMSRFQGSTVGDGNPVTAFVVSGASGVAVPVSEPLQPSEVRQLVSSEVIDQVAAARRDAGVV